MGQATRCARRAQRLAAGVARAAIAALATTAVLAGCAGSASDPQSSHRHPGAQRQNSHRLGVPGRDGSGLAAVRRGLTQRAAAGPVYYLSLGDSLARGIQPTATGQNVPTERGYADQLAARLRGAIPRLRLVKLSCSGETTWTMIDGGICEYPARSQLAQAVSFLRAHRGRTALVTIDIGGNDPNSCVIGAQPETIVGCLASRVPQLERNLSTILSKLRAAAGSRVLIVGMTYYVPELGLWQSGRRGRQIGMLTDAFAAGVNRILASRYHRYGARVANVFAAFRSTDFGPGGPARASRSRRTPPNVTAICALTWMCAASPRGPNEHANEAGYRVIARTFWRAITS
jgi:lysophospholipase L1-like esterase